MELAHINHGSSSSGGSLNPCIRILKDQTLFGSNIESPRSLQVQIRMGFSVLHILTRYHHVEEAP